MHRVLLAAAAFGILSGCASMDDGLKKLQGQPLNAVIAKIGMPTDERTIAGQKVYIWHTRTIVEGTERACTVRVIMSGNVVGSYDWEGNLLLCSQYASRLES